ncbi:hypothetical protein FACS1894133_4050 [Clostridia bacterium]|nr:hypothetical protein FACS1894133_4050 [Clostridia bacterium]
MSLGGRAQTKKNSPVAESEVKKAVPVKFDRPPLTRDDVKHILFRVGAGIVALVVLAGVVIGYDKFF